jgi:4-hydroxy 2-oxovalerate aldolase
MENKTSNSLILDCTLRDGGYINNWSFTDEEVLSLYKSASLSGVDYIEIGFKNNTFLYNNKLVGKWYNVSDKDINNIVEQYPNGCKIAVMINYDETFKSQFLPKDESNISMIRVATTKKNYIEACGFCAYLKQLGYEVCLNPIGTENYSDEELFLLCKLVSENDIDFLYIADTYGSLKPSNITQIFDKMKNNFRNINPSFKYRLGFHAHNNIGRAFTNAMFAIEQNVDIVDTTMFGMGRGSGNANTELVIAELALTNSKRYNPLPALEFINNVLCIIQKQLDKDIKWGYCIPAFITGYLSCHPNYGIKLQEFGFIDTLFFWNTIKQIVTDQKHVDFDLPYLVKLLKDQK